MKTGFFPGYARKNQVTTSWKPGFLFEYQNPGAETIARWSPDSLRRFYVAWSQSYAQLQSSAVDFQRTLAYPFERSNNNCLMDRLIAQAFNVDSSAYVLEGQQWIAAEGSSFNRRASEELTYCGTELMNTLLGHADE